MTSTTVAIIMLIVCENTQVHIAVFITNPRAFWLDIYIYIIGKISMILDDMSSYCHFYYLLLRNYSQLSCADEANPLRYDVASLLLSARRISEAILLVENVTSLGSSVIVGLFIALYDGMLVNESLNMFVCPPGLIVLFVNICFFIWPKSERTFYRVSFSKHLFNPIN